jgi:CheY-like chemotaxis protein
VNANANASEGRDKLVVIADDDLAMRDLFALALATEGYRIVAVATGQALVDQVQRILQDGEHGGVLDLIISDVRMPEMDGVRALQFLRDSEVRVPFIFVTAFSDLWTRTAATRYGAEVLDKPVQLQKLRAVVHVRLAS